MTGARRAVKMGVGYRVAHWRADPKFTGMCRGLSNALDPKETLRWR
jgi:hypothetical protein